MPIRYLSGINVDSDVLVVDAANDRVGIGTTAPAFKLDVAGDINTNGAYRIGGSSIVSGTTNVVVGSAGATGTVSLTTTSGAGIVLNGSNVGIGTASPTAKLHIQGNLRIETDSEVGADIVLRGGSIFPTISRNTNTGGIIIDSVGNYVPGESFSFRKAGSSLFTINELGNVGIGTTAPTSKLDVDGSIRFNGRVEGRTFPHNSTFGSGADATTTTLDAGSTNSFRSSVILAGGTATDPNTIKLLTASTERMRITSAGNVGIGTTAPSQRLEVIGVGSFNNSASSRKWLLDATNGVIQHNFNGNVETQLGFNGGTTFFLGQNVGIGTTAPGAILHTSDASGATRVVVDNTANAAAGAGVFFRTFSGGTQVSNATVRIDNAGNFSIFTGTTSEAERMRITSGGNVLIGTTTDSGFKLDVNGTARVGALTGTSATFSGIINANSAATAANGSINIDNSDPTLRFRRAGGTVDKSIYEFRAIAVGGVNDIMQLRLWNDAQTIATTLMTVSPTGAGTFSNALQVAGQQAAANYGGTGLNFDFTTGNIGRIASVKTTSGGSQLQFLVYNTSGVDISALGIASTGAATFSSSVTATNFNLTDAGGGAVNNVNGNLFLQTGAGTGWIFRNGASGFTEYMRLTAGGNLLIGTTVDYTKLTVSNGNTTRTGVTLSDANTCSLMLFAGASTLASINFDAFGLRFMGGSTAGVDNGTEIMRLTTSYNVLIGTTTDSGYKLRVNGTGRYDGNLQLWTDVGGASPRLIFGGETSNTDKSIFLETFFMVFQGHDNEGFKFQTTSSAGVVSNRMSILGTGTIVLSNYGTGTKTGTPAFNLAVDSSGNIIETPGGVVDGSGTANFVTKWQDANTVTNSIIRDDGTTVGVGQAPGAAKFSVDGSTFGAGKFEYFKSQGSLNTTGVVVAAIPVSTNGQSSFFIFEAGGGFGAYQKVVYTCYNAGGTWNVVKAVDEGTNQFDVVASAASGATITFTWKTRSVSTDFTPRLFITASGIVDTSYL